MRSAALVLVFALAGCGLFRDPERVRAPYVGAAVALEPKPVVRVLVSRDARDPAAVSVDSVTLVSPGGETFSAGPGQWRESRQPYKYSSRPGVFGSGSASNVPGNFGIKPPVARRGAFISLTAPIPLSNLEAYRRTYAQWIIEVVLSGEGGKQTRITIPAPPVLIEN